MSKETDNDLPEIDRENLPPLDSSPINEKGVFDAEDEEEKIELSVGDIIVHHWPDGEGPKQFNLIISLGGRISWDQAIVWDIERNKYNVIYISKIIKQIPNPSVNIDIRKDPFNLREEQENNEE